jgi:sugar phosphate permease
MPGYVALALSYVLSQFYRSFLAVLAPVLSVELSMSPGELAVASGAWFTFFALMQFPVGYWLDTRGPRWTAALLHGLAGGGGAALFALSSSALHIIIAMGLLGIGCAPVLMATIYLFARNSRPAVFATLSSTFIAVGTLGNIFASAPMAAAIDAIGWRATSWLLALVTVGVGAAIFLLVRDPPASRAAPAGNGDDTFLALLRIRQLWPILPCIFLGYTVAAGIRGLWAGPYLEQMHGMDVRQIGNATLYMAIALSIGSLVYGPLDRLFNSRKLVVLVGNLIVAVAAGWLAVAPQVSQSVAVFLFTVIGFFGASYAVQIAHGKAFVPAHLAGRGITLMNFFAIGGVGVMQLATGATFEAISAAGRTDTAFDAIFALYTVTLIATLAIYLFARDAKPSQDVILK